MPVLESGRQKAHSEFDASTIYNEIMPQKRVCGGGIERLDIVAQTFNSSALGGKGRQKSMRLRPAWAI